MIASLVKLAAGLAFFSVMSAVMIFVMVGAAQSWVSLVEVMLAGQGYMRQAGNFLGWLLYVLRIDFLTSAIVFVSAMRIAFFLWWSIKTS